MGPNRTRINRLTMMPRAAHQCRTCAERVARTVGPPVQPLDVLPRGGSRQPRRHVQHARAEVIGIAVVDEQGRPLYMLDPGSRILVRISVRARQYLPMPIVGFMLRNQLGMDFSGTNTAREGYEIPPMQPGDVFTVDFYLDLPELYPASFSFSPAIADGTLTGYQMCDWIDNAIALQMGRSEAQVYGYIHLPCRVEVNSRIRTEGREPALLEENQIVEDQVG